MANLCRKNVVGLEMMAPIDDGAGVKRKVFGRKGENKCIIDTTGRYPDSGEMA
jgi:hypothetical protein